jgi:protein AroM
MTRVGLITVGQAPRSDVVPDMAAILGGDVEIVEAGALDGLSREQIEPLAPEGDDEILVTRLADGSSVFVGKTRMIPRIEAKIGAPRSTCSCAPGSSRSSAPGGRSSSHSSSCWACSARWSFPAAWAC